MCSACASSCAPAAWTRPGPSSRRGCDASGRSRAQGRGTRRAPTARRSSSSRSSTRSGRGGAATHPRARGVALGERSAPPSSPPSRSSGSATPSSFSPANDWPPHPPRLRSRRFAATRPPSPSATASPSAARGSRPCGGSPAPTGWRATWRPRERAAAEGVEIGEGAGDVWVVALGEMALAAASHIVRGRVADAVDHRLPRARHLRECGDRFGRAATRLWLSLAYLRLRQRGATAATWTICLALCESEGYDFLFTAPHPPRPARPPLPRPAADLARALPPLARLRHPPAERAGHQRSRPATLAISCACRPSAPSACGGARRRWSRGPGSATRPANCSNCC